MVGVRGFEPPAPAFRTQYSNQAELHSVAGLYSGTRRQTASQRAKIQKTKHFQLVIVNLECFVVSSRHVRVLPAWPAAFRQGFVWASRGRGDGARNPVAVA